MKPVIENTSAFLQPRDINFKAQIERRQDGHWDEIDDDQDAPFDVGRPLDRKNVGEMNEEDRKKGDPGKGDLHPLDCTWGRLAVDHQELSHMPRRKRQDEPGKEAVYTDVGLRVGGFPRGTYRVEIWDTLAGKVKEKHSVTVLDGMLAFPISKFTNDAAIKIKVE